MEEGDIDDWSHVPTGLARQAKPVKPVEQGGRVVPLILEQQDKRAKPPETKETKESKESRESAQPTQFDQEETELARIKKLFGERYLCEAVLNELDKDFLIKHLDILFKVACRNPLSFLIRWLYDTFKHQLKMETINMGLVWASEAGVSDNVIFLIAIGADVTYEDSFAIRRASLSGSLECVKLLYGCFRSKASKTSVEITSFKDEVSFNGLGADIHALDEAVMVFAILNRRVDIINWFLSLPIDFDTKLILKRVNELGTQVSDNKSRYRLVIEKEPWYITVKKQFRQKAITSSKALSESGSSGDSSPRSSPRSKRSIMESDFIYKKQKKKTRTVLPEVSVVD